MDTAMLIKIKNEAEIKATKIGMLLDYMKLLEAAINDLKYLQRHAGKMILSGSSEKIDDGSIRMRTVELNTVSGCVLVPKLMIELAENKLASLEEEANAILNT